MAATRKRSSPRRVVVESDNGWHLDRRVPIALILAIIGQFGGFVYVWADMQNAIQKNTEYTQELKVSSKERDKKLERLITLEADIKHVRSTMKRVEATIDKIFTAELKSNQRSRREARRRAD